MVDVELLEAAVKQKVLERKYPKQNVPVYYRQIMEKHGITYEQFQQSYHWWEDHPKELKSIYDEVNKRLIQMKEELPKDEKKENEKPKGKEKKK